MVLWIGLGFIEPKKKEKEKREFWITYQLPHSAMTLTLGRSVGSKARNCNSDLERTCAKKGMHDSKIWLQAIY